MIYKCLFVWLNFLESEFFSIVLDQIEIVGFEEWEDDSPWNAFVEVNLLKSNLKIATVKMKNLKESLSAVKIERDNLKNKLKNLVSINYFEVNKLRDLKAKLWSCRCCLYCHLMCLWDMSLQLQVMQFLGCSVCISWLQFSSVRKICFFWLKFSSIFLVWRFHM